MEQAEKISDQELERQISRFMLELAVKSEEMMNAVTKLLYPDLARMYGTTAQKIERAIRNAIEVSWERGNSDIFEELFGYRNTSEYSRPTNSEYIATVADYIRLEYDLIER